ncbi:hypothetical protein QAD02_007177 [Eretmocerus hayati]|uniref:Uncharacterized protein n=1 Tax=Eretmocerus hayati TaxID=131215 RepID=A0ACC2N2X5_9HYME|nr:hypothetical protein QAD02_007177 [Eretmocerus hayati]
MTKAKALVRVENLPFYYKTLCLNHNKVIADFGVDKELDYLKLKTGDSFEESYMDNEAEFQGFLDSIADLDRSSIETNATVAPASQTVVAPASSYSLARIETPTFSTNGPIFGIFIKTWRVEGMRLSQW